MESIANNRALTNLVKPKHFDVDNFVKKLSGKYCLAFFTLSLILVGRTKWAHDPLVCHSASTDISIRFLEAHCYDLIPFVIKTM